MLRTLIEQDMRARTKRNELRGEDLCSAYAETLDEGFRKKFPSFREIYEKLSEAIHKAAADDALFRSERERIELHYRGRVAFEEAEGLANPR